MTNQIVWIVRFRVNARSRTLLEGKLKEVFDVMQHEDAFVNATLHEDPEQLLVYEVWRETRASFLANQMSKSYRSTFEQAILDLKVERTAQWLKAISIWKQTNGQAHPVAAAPSNSSPV
jgi:quinol monooxygenase YgiN